MSKRVKITRLAALQEVLKGGTGSGNFGHAGRPGQVGGSGEGSAADSDTVSVSTLKLSDAEAGDHAEVAVKAMLKRAMAIKDPDETQAYATRLLESIESNVNFENAMDDEELDPDATRYEERVLTLSDASGRPVASAYVLIVPRDGQKVWDLEYLATAPDALRQGHGARLLHETLKLAANQDATAVHLFVESTAPWAKAFYDKSSLHLDTTRGDKDEGWFYYADQGDLNALRGRKALPPLVTWQVLAKKGFEPVAGRAKPTKTKKHLRIIK